MARKIKKKPVIQAPVVKKDATSWTEIFKNYPRVIGIFVLSLFMPPLGWIFAYKFSPYDRKTTFAITATCTAFFVYAVFISPEREWVDVRKLTPVEFCTRYNDQARKLAPNIGVTIDEEKLSVDGVKFSYDITADLNFAAQTANDFVKEITVTATPKNTDDSFQALNCFGLVIATLNPELSQEKRGDVLRELKMLDKAVSDDLNESTTSGGITYGVKSFAEKIIFTARINDDF